MATVAAIKSTDSIGETVHKSSDSNYEILRLPDGRIAYVFNPLIKLGPSKSGKTTLVSSTSGAVKLGGLPTISVNVYQ
jgi:hypothetical protein